MSFFKKFFKKREEKNKDEIVQKEELIEEAEEETIEEEPAAEEETIEEEPEAEEEMIEEEPVAQEETIEEEPVAQEQMIEEEPVEEELVVEEPVEEEQMIEEEPTAEEEMIEEEPAVEEETIEEEPVAQEEVVTPEPKKKGFFSKLVEGLTKTRDNILGSVDDVLKSFKKIDEELYEELEEALIVADFGVETSLNIMEQLKKSVKEKKLTEPMELKHEIKEIVTGMLTSVSVEPIVQEGKQNVILVIGVNGVGKTTTIGKLANQLKGDHKKVILAAADTFRAAAIEQLQVWSNRAGVDLIKHGEGSDPAAVVFDAIQASKSRKADVLICDTAGRLQNKVNLMKELGKISKVIEKEYPEAHKEVLIVLDATTGQNALQQVKVFNEVADVDGIILTKLDGTAKGGAIVSICNMMNVPVKYIGVGEKIEDLQPFDPEAFAKALFVEK